MRLEEAVKTFLASDTALAGLVGTRVWKNKIPEKPTYPAIRYFRVSGEEPYTHSGATSLPTARLQFDCMAPGDAQAAAVADALRTAFNGFACPAVMGGSGGVRVDDITVNASIDGWDDDLEVTVVSVDVEITHER